MIDLEKKYIDFIKKAISDNLNVYKIYIFGSRVKGKAKKYSDIDLAIEAKELTPEIKSKLDFIFESSLLPYEVDIIDLNNISESFREIIINDLVELE